MLRVHYNISGAKGERNTHTHTTLRVKPSTFDYGNTDRPVPSSSRSPPPGHPLLRPTSSARQSPVTLGGSASRPSVPFPGRDRRVFGVWTRPPAWTDAENKIARHRIRLPPVHPAELRPANAPRFLFQTIIPFWTRSPGPGTPNRRIRNGSRTRRQVRQDARVRRLHDYVVIHYRKRTKKRRQWPTTSSRRSPAGETAKVFLGGGEISVRNTGQIKTIIRRISRRSLHGNLQYKIRSVNNNNNSAAIIVHSYFIVFIV